MYIEHGNLIHMALNNKFDVIIHGLDKQKQLAKK